TSRTTHATASAPTFPPNRDCRRFRDRHTASGPRAEGDLFFGARTTASRQSDMIGRPIAQVIVEFVSVPPDRFRMQAGDLGEPLEASMPQMLRLACCHPAPLLLIQPAQQQIELPMIFLFRMFARKASRTTALMNRPWCAHCPTPFLGVPDSL